MRRLRCLAMLLLGLGLLPLAPAADPAPVQVVSPPANAILPAAPFYVIARGAPADLMVDGRLQAWGLFAGPVRAARLRLEAGRHELRIGTHKITVSVQGGPAPPMGADIRLHPIGAGAESCGACHQTSRHDERTVVGAAKSFAACQDCHQPAQFEARHAHPLDPLKHCGSCHAPHGSLFKGLLKAPVKKLCAACHES